MGLLLASISFRAQFDLGDLNPTKPVCAVTTLGSISRLALRMTVSGPGQNYYVSFLNSSSSYWEDGRTSLSADQKSSTWTIIGSVSGRLLTRQISSRAASLVASAPSPQTVSVGKPTSCPFLSISPSTGRYQLLSGTTVTLVLSIVTPLDSDGLFLERNAYNSGRRCYQGSFVAAFGGVWAFLGWFIMLLAYINNYYFLLLVFLLQRMGHHVYEILAEGLICITVSIYCRAMSKILRAECKDQPFYLMTTPRFQRVEPSAAWKLGRVLRDMRQSSQNRSREYTSIREKCLHQIETLYSSSFTTCCKENQQNLRSLFGAIVADCAGVTSSLQNVQIEKKLRDYILKRLSHEKTVQSIGLLVERQRL